jgi:hypothetical protein
VTQQAEVQQAPPRTTTPGTGNLKVAPVAVPPRRRGRQQQKQAGGATRAAAPATPAQQQQVQEVGRAARGRLAAAAAAVVVASGAYRGRAAVGMVAGTSGRCHQPPSGPGPLAPLPLPTRRPQAATLHQLVMVVLLVPMIGRPMGCSITRMALMVVRWRQETMARLCCRLSLTTGALQGGTPM